MARLTRFVQNQSVVDGHPKRFPLWLLLLVEASVAVGMWFAAPVIVRHIIAPMVVDPETVYASLDMPLHRMFNPGSMRRNDLDVAGRDLLGSVEELDVYLPSGQALGRRVFSGKLAMLLLLGWTALNLLLVHLRWWRRKKLVTLVGAVVSVGVLVASVAILVKVA